MENIEREVIPENVGQEIVDLGHTAFEAETLLCSYFNEDLSKEIKEEHVQNCKVMLVELRAAIVSFAETKLNDEEERHYLI